MKKGIKNWSKLVFFLYLFLFSINLIKRASIALAPNINNFLIENFNPIKAVCVGWFTTAIAQSSGAVGTITATFAGSNLISLSTAVYILIGSALGTTITALIISLVIISNKRKDFRHGFEIGLSYAIYSALIVIIGFLLEYFFNFFSKISFSLAKFSESRIAFLQIPDFVGLITDPILNVLFNYTNLIFILFLGFLILILDLKYLSKSIIAIFGGEEKTRKFINKYFDSKYKAYFLGVILTAIVFSSSITIGLLVPLAVARVINLKKAIPFIIGADLGTSTDLFLATLIIGKTNALATAFAYALIPLLGALIFLPNTNILHRITKYTSKKLIHISRKKALYILLAFILIPLLVIWIF
jgi:solute carrier family 34 (sodium-dependent phosphate cotransporter)